VKIPLLSKTTSTTSSTSTSNIFSPTPRKSEVPDSVVEARKNRTDAALVRVMKTQKTLEHSALVEEAIKQLPSGWPVETHFINKRIESLIEREYLERDKQNNRTYHFLA